MAYKTYIERLQMVISELYGCDSRHVESVPVHEVFQRKTVWNGVVEIFDLVKHPKAKRCFAWSHAENPDGTGERLVALLEIPPVDSPSTAVQASIVSDAKKCA
jgi:hypothetical protein